MNQALLYSKYNGLQRADAQYVLDNYFRLINWRADGTERILDIGCGAGDVTTRMLLPRLPTMFANLVGADLSAEMVEFARTKWCAGPTSDGRVTFNRLDIAADLVCPEWTLAFDHIVSFYCLHWIQDQRKALYNMSVMLKPGGDILLTFLASNPIFHIYENLARNDKWAAYMANTHKYISPLQYSREPEVEFERMLRDSGFTVHLCKVVERQYVYPDLTVLRKSVIAVSPFIANIPDNLQNDYLADFIEEVRDLKYIDYNSNNNEEKVSVPYRLLVVFARKPM